MLFLEDKLLANAQCVKYKACRLAIIIRARGKPIDPFFIWKRSSLRFQIRGSRQPCFQHRYIVWILKYTKGCLPLSPPCSSLYYTHFSGDVSFIRLLYAGADRRQSGFDRPLGSLPVPVRQSSTSPGSHFHRKVENFSGWFKRFSWPDYSNCLFEEVKQPYLNPEDSNSIDSGQARFGHPDRIHPELRTRHYWCQTLPKRFSPRLPTSSLLWSRYK